MRCDREKLSYSRQDLSDKESAGLPGIKMQGLLVTSAQLSLLTALLAVTHVPQITKLHIQVVYSSYPSVFEIFLPCFPFLLRSV